MEFALKSQESVQEETASDVYDVVILGAGKAGLTLALQLRRKSPSLRIAIIEKNTFPVPESAHKVGESTVEMSARYFRQELGLQGILQEEHLPKCGLRFFFPAGDNSDITKRVEMGHFTWPLQPSDQIERGRFENRLAGLLKDEHVDLFDGWKAGELTLSDASEANALHSVELIQKDSTQTLKARWIVDATGRASRLKKQLGLEQKVKHDCSAVWFRVDDRIALDEWGSGEDWDWSMNLRYLGTNHLMGNGYWVWLIPLASGATSVGIVFESSFVDFEDVSTFDRAMTWLEKNEPQCAQKLREAKGECLDFKVMRKYSRQTSAFFSPSRWALTGESASFADPFYSSGADFIAMANTMICDLVLREHQGECIAERTDVYNHLIMKVFDSFLDLFRKQYHIMGHAQVMIAKIVWDFSVYWAFTCPLFFQGKMLDVEFLRRLGDLFERMTYLNKTVQRLFHRWSKLDDAEWSQQRVDYGKIQFMQGLLYNLTISLEDDACLQALEDNFRVLQTVARQFIEYATKRCPKLKEYPSLSLEYAIQPVDAPTNGCWVPRHLNTHLSIEEDLARIWLKDEMWEAH